jgi:antitoxin component YwqK of YwqJK toxin-antitoxin module
MKTCFKNDMSEGNLASYYEEGTVNKERTGTFKNGNASTKHFAR